MFDLSYRLLRRVAIGVVGATIVLIGVIMLVTPGPAIIVIPAGLAVLSLEFAFARRLLRRFKERIAMTTSPTPGAERGSEEGEDQRQGS